MGRILKGWQWGTWQGKMWGYDPEGPTKHFAIYFWYHRYPINLGIHVSVHHPNIELHIPFGFIRIGWVDGL